MGLEGDPTACILTGNLSPRELTPSEAFSYGPLTPKGPHSPARGPVGKLDGPVGPVAVLPQGTPLESGSVNRSVLVCRPRHGSSRPNSALTSELCHLLQSLPPLPYFVLTMSVLWLSCLRLKWTEEGLFNSLQQQ